MFESSILHKQNNYQQAKQKLDYVLELENNNLAALYRLGVYAYKEDNIKLAHQYFIKIIEIERA